VRSNICCSSQLELWKGRGWFEPLLVSSMMPLAINAQIPNPYTGSKLQQHFICWLLGETKTSMNSFEDASSKSIPLCWLLILQMRPGHYWQLFVDFSLNKTSSSLWVNKWPRFWPLNTRRLSVEAHFLYHKYLCKLKKKTFRSSFQLVVHSRH